MTTRGAGSLRQRRPGVWEVRVSLGLDPVSGRSWQRSVTVHGDRDVAEERRGQLAGAAYLWREAHRAEPVGTFGELLDVWLAGPHAWKPATWQGYRGAVRRLRADPLAADTGARRGELAALRLDDLHGRVLWLQRGVSAEVVTSTKTGRARRVTVGAGTAALWNTAIGAWQLRLGTDEQLGPWLFSSHLDHHQRARCDTLAHWFADFVRRHDHPDVCLHRLRHTVATSTLVASGQLLQAQQRLGHRDTSTTRRQYCHALPLYDVDVADHLEALLEGAERSTHRHREDSP